MDDGIFACRIGQTLFPYNYVENNPIRNIDPDGVWTTIAGRVTSEKGSVYAEFSVPTQSLLKGGKEGWFKVIGPSASKAMKAALEKQGGDFLPQIKNLSPILKVK